MGKDIVLLHGANEGSWCFDQFKAVFEGVGWTCHAPDLIGHGTKATGADKTLVGVGMEAYRAELEAFSKPFPPSRCCLAIRWGRSSPSSLPRRVLPARSLWWRPRRAPASCRRPMPRRNSART